MSASVRRQFVGAATAAALLSLSPHALSSDFPKLAKRPAPVTFNLSPESADRFQASRVSAGIILAINKVDPSDTSKIWTTNDDHFFCPYAIPNVCRQIHFLPHLTSDDVDVRHIALQNQSFATLSVKSLKCPGSADEERVALSPEETKQFLSAGDINVELLPPNRKIAKEVVIIRDAKENYSTFILAGPQYNSTDKIIDEVYAGADGDFAGYVAWMKRPELKSSVVPLGSENAAQSGARMPIIMNNYRRDIDIQGWGRLSLPYRENLFADQSIVTEEGSPLFVSAGGISLSVEKQNLDKWRVKMHQLNILLDEDPDMNKASIDICANQNEQHAAVRPASDASGTSRFNAQLVGMQPAPAK